MKLSSLKPNPQLVLGTIPTLLLVFSYFLQYNNLGSECIIVFATGHVTCTSFYAIPLLAPLSSAIVTSNMFVAGLLGVGFQAGHWFAGYRKPKSLAAEPEKVWVG